MPFAHRQLGLIYEQLQDLDKAQSYYKLALQGNLPIAYSDVSRLYLLNKKPNEAVSLLYTLSTVLYKNNQAKEKANHKLTEEDNFLLYQLYNNRGWARFQQQFYADAKIDLEKAITYDNKLSDRSYKNGAAYCLLAQVLENLEKPKEAIIQWKLCIAYGNNRLPEIAGWKAIASQRFKTEEK
ncbi:hypothetical protein [Nodularia spumigena]|uniref:hypothetical protein n=1 Tax=Nodularia spumigena TaxID=70799 RepID=UPI000D30E49C|nr:hypothetical protein [Nodularia spumigena]